MPDIGEKEKEDMKKKAEYSDAPKQVAESISLSERIEDFLPPPDRLIRKSEKVKITITLDCESVAFFKASAKKNNVKAYMILNFRDLSETYAIDIHNFDEFYKMTSKKSISIDEARQLGKQLSQQKKRTRYRYEISDLFN